MKTRKERETDLAKIFGDLRKPLADFMSEMLDEADAVNPEWQQTEVGSWLARTLGKATNIILAENLRDFCNPALVGELALAALLTESLSGGDETNAQFVRRFGPQFEEMKEKAGEAGDLTLASSLPSDLN